MAVSFLSPQCIVLIIHKLENPDRNLVGQNNIEGEMHEGQESG